MNAIKIFLTFLIIHCLGGNLLAQNQRADSVQKILDQKIPDSTRAYNMVMLAMYTEGSDMAKAHELYKETVNFALSKNLDYHAGLALRYQATPYHLNGERAKEIDNIMRAITLFSSSDHPKAKLELASTFGNLSNYYRMVEKFDSAVTASLKGIQILEEIKNYPKLTAAYLNLSMVYQQLGIPEKQLEYVKKGLTSARLSGRDMDILVAYLQMGRYFTSINEHIKAKSYVDSSVVYFNEQIDFSRKQDYYLSKAGTFQNVKMYDSAIAYFEKCYQLARQVGYRWNQAEPLMQIGYINQQQEKYPEAEKYLRLGLEIAEADSIRVFMKEGYGILSEVLAATGQHKFAYDYLQKYNDLKDTLFSEERKKYALDLEKRYETEKKDAQLKLQQAELKQRTLLNYSLMAGAVILLLVFFLFYRNYRIMQTLQRQRIAELETEKQLMASEAVLKGEEQERTRLAKDLHDGLGGMLSGIKFTMNAMKENLIMTPDNAQSFARSMDMLDSSIREMRRVAHNLMPETLVKFGLDTALRDFCSDINQSGMLKVVYQSFGLEQATLEQTVSISIYRIIQELLNNSLKHAAAKTAMVQVSLMQNRVSVTVEDDGIGFDPSQLRDRQGMGWSNIQSRVDFLKGKLDLQSSPNMGTSVHIEFDL